MPVVRAVSVAAGPIAVGVPDNTNDVYVADRSGAIWTMNGGQPILRMPFNVQAEPSGLAADASQIYVAAQSAMLTLDASSGRQVASVPLGGQSGDLQVDSALGLAEVVIADQGAIATIDLRSQSVVRTTTGIAIDREKHVLYVSELGGDLSVIDEQSNAITATLHVSEVGLAGVAVAPDGHVYAINTPGQELIIMDPATVTATDVPLDIQPEALAAGPQSGVAYVLDSNATLVARFAVDGTRLGDLPFNDAGDQPVPLQAASLWRRPRVAVNALDETVYVTEPDGGTLAIISGGS
jgi:DNA-binding beta-propeller fold protein YncE